MDISKIKVKTVVIFLVLIPVAYFLLIMLSLIISPLTPKVSSSSNLFAIFLTGLFVGGLSCLAVQGGLLAATIAQSEEEKLKSKLENSGNAAPILAFLVAKLVAYIILGFLLGWFGSFFKLSITTQVIMQFAVAIFMVGTALNLLEVHPVFRYFAIQPPRFLYKLVRKQSKSSTVFAPALLGALTVFIPCGTTQAMMALSIGSGNPFMGAAILGAFVLGTSPLFFILGYFATKLGDSMHQKFMKVAATALILLAIFNVNNAIALTGSNFTLENTWNSLFKAQPAQNNNPTALTSATINFEQGGYSPTSFNIKSGAKITVHLVNNNGAGCIQSFVIPSLGLSKIVPQGSSDTLTFTAPTEKGSIAFMCGMGMYRGMMNVI